MSKKKNMALLREEFDRVVAQYVAALLRQFEWDAYYGYWIADDCTGIYSYGEEFFISLADIIYIVDNNIPKDVFKEWHWYGVFAHEFNQQTPNLDAWVKGCPRLSKEEQDRLRTLKNDFEKACDDYKNNTNPF